MEYNNQKIGESLSPRKTNPENAKSQYPLSFRLKQSFLLAALGFSMALSGCGVVENRAIDRITAAGVPVEAVTNELIDFVMWSNPSDAEILDFVRTSKLWENPSGDPDFNPARETQMAIDATKQAEATSTLPAELTPTVIETGIDLEEVSSGVYSFVAEGAMEVANRDFAQSLKDALKQATGTDSADVAFAVPDDAYGIKRIFLQSNVDAYQGHYGEFYAYQGDTIYVAASTQALIDFFKSTGINYETFSSLP
jgi:hypothetical protein